MEDFNMKTTNLIFKIFCCVVGLSAVADNSVQGAEVVGIIKGADTSFTNRRTRGCSYNGKCIPNGSSFQVSACESCHCDNGRVLCAIKDCAKPPPGCTYVRTATECCKLSCKKGCFYKGVFIPEGTTSTVAPCTYGSCNGGKVFIAIADCAPPPPGCRYESTMDECCKMICDKGCVYNDIFIPEGTTSIVAPCTYGSCNGGKVFIAIADCAKPPEGCRYEPTMEQCCKLNCEEGCYYNDMFIPEGTTSTVEPCTYGTCNNGEILTAVADCAPPPPGCRYESTMEECCKLNCEKGCFYNDIFIAEGTTSTVEPCKYGTCDGGKVFIAVADCAKPPEGCRYEPTMEQCCRLICDNPPILIKEAIV